MFSVCANKDCHAPFDYRQSLLFRFHKDHPANEKPPNTHSVQHFWLCGDAAMAERAECVMLNKGPYIVSAVRILDDILRRTQAHQEKKRSTLPKLHLADAFRVGA
jgi:hypothetical protein